MQPVYFKVCCQTSQRILLVQWAQTNRLQPQFWDFPGGVLSSLSITEKEIQKFLQDVFALSSLSLQFYDAFSLPIKNKMFTHQVYTTTSETEHDIIIPSAYQQWQWFSFEELKNIPVVPYIRLVVLQ